jgi:hypothetical protein
MDKLVTDNLTNRLKDAINRQVFGNMFETQQNDTIQAKSLPAEYPIGL